MKPDLSAELRERIRQIADAAPPLTDEQRDRLALLLKPVKPAEAPRDSRNPE